MVRVEIGNDCTAGGQVDRLRRGGGWGQCKGDGIDGGFRRVGIRNHITPEAHRCGGFPESAQHRLFALFRAQQPGVKDREGKYGSDYHEGDENDGRFQAGDSSLVLEKCNGSA